ncbi:hypothetical protein [Nocardia sp. NPDC049526]|uniref:hypothetical protein n=1 Tax=Nocardia sp. NPDC049526 TaxID=3364316 RepID=UPI00378CC1F7
MRDPLRRCRIPVDVESVTTRPAECGPTAVGMTPAAIERIRDADTEGVCGHVGFTNILGWADPNRALWVGLITSGKLVRNAEVFGLLCIPGLIGSTAPRVAG